MKRAIIGLRWLKELTFRKYQYLPIFGTLTTRSYLEDNLIVEDLWKVFYPKKNLKIFFNLLKYPHKMFLGPFFWKTLGFQTKKEHIRAKHRDPANLERAEYKGTKTNYTLRKQEEHMGRTGNCHDGIWTWRSLENILSKMFSSKLVQKRGKTRKMSNILESRGTDILIPEEGN